MQLFSARLSDFTNAAYCHVIGEIGTGFYFDLRLPRSTYEGQYVQEGCGGFCGFLSPQVPLVSDDCPAVTGNTLALAVDNEGHVTTTTTDARWAAQRCEEPYPSSARRRSTSWPSWPRRSSPTTTGGVPLTPTSTGAPMAGEKRSSRPSAIRTTSTGSWPGRRPTSGRSWWASSIVGTFGSTPDSAVERSSPRKSFRPSMRPCCGHVARVGGYVLDPRTCNFSPSRIECHGRVTNSCLTAAQAQVVTSLYRGPTDPAGQSLYPGGEPYGSELGWPAWFVKPSGDRDWPQDTLSDQFAINFLRYLAYGTDPPSSYSLSQFRFTLPDYRKLTSLSALYDATNPDLSSFAADGGRLIIYQGWADQAIPPFGTVAYYKAVVDAAGGYQASQTFSRLYMIPAQYHCLAGGDPALTGANLLTPLFDWVQHGTPPGTLSLNLEINADGLRAGRRVAGRSCEVAPLDPPDATTSPGSKGCSTRIPTGSARSAQMSPVERRSTGSGVRSAPKYASVSCAEGDPDRRQNDSPCRPHRPRLKIANSSRAGS